MVRWHSTHLNATINEIKKYYTQIESEYGANKQEYSFLWDHCHRVASIAIWLKRHILALPEHQNISDEVVFLTGLLHDSGKFQALKFKELNVPEETYSAQIAQRLLEEFKWGIETISYVCEAIKDLYHENSHNPLSHLVRDADTLSKLGSQGVISYISKWTIRGSPPLQIVKKKLSIELTYAFNAKHTMLTPQGRKEAIKEAKWTLTFFKNLLNQWRQQQVIDLEIQNVKVEEFQIVHVLHSKYACKHMKWKYSLISGVKCTKVLITGNCINCNISEKEEFCLPLLLKS